MVDTMTYAEAVAQRSVTEMLNGHIFARLKQLAGDEGNLSAAGILGALEHNKRGNSELLASLATKLGKVIDVSFISDESSITPGLSLKEMLVELGFDKLTNLTRAQIDFGNDIIGKPEKPDPVWEIYLDFEEVAVRLLGMLMEVA